MIYPRYRQYQGFGEPTPPMLGITKLHVGRAMVMGGTGFLIKTMFFTKDDEGFWPSMGLGAFIIALGFWTGPSHQ
jgi:hypothetical protein